MSKRDFTRVDRILKNEQRKKYAEKFGEQVDINRNKPRIEKKKPKKNYVYIMEK